MATLTFFGAAGNVTGSCYLFEANGNKLLIDCGMFQERDLNHRNWEPFLFPPGELDGVLLTHAHLDHCGLLPKLMRYGFGAPIYCTSATKDIAEIIMMDAAKIQAEDAAFKEKRHRKENRTGRFPPVPLYEAREVEQVCSLFKTVNYEQPLLINGLEISFHEAGHILGSASIRIRFLEKGSSRTLVFSGDVGRPHVPIIKDPWACTEADYIVLESTYGNRTHDVTSGVEESLAKSIRETSDAGGNILIPSFAVERTQELLFHLNTLLLQGRIPHLITFVDSPMATKVTEVFKRHPELFDAETMELLKQGRHPCDFPGLVLCRSVAESKGINRIKGSVVIIAGSGMCTGGRIKHHLVNNIGHARNTVLFVGYQAVGTLGRHILEGSREVRIHGKQHVVQARIRRINGFSGHADREELQSWLSYLKKPPRQIFITHGEPDAASALAETLNKKNHLTNYIPKYAEELILS